MRKILVSVVALFVLVAGVFLLNSQATEAGGGKTVLTVKVDWGHQESDGRWMSSIWIRSSPPRDVQQFVYFRPGIVPSGGTKQVDENGTISNFAANNHIYKAVGFQLMEPGGSRSFLRTYWNGESELGPEFRYSRTTDGNIIILGVNKTGRTLSATADGGKTWYDQVATQEWVSITTREAGELHFYESTYIESGEIAYIAWEGNTSPPTPTPTATTTPTPTAMPTMTPTPTATPAPISPIIESVSSYTAAPGDVVIIRGRNFNKADNSDLSNLMVWLVHDDGGVATLASVIPRVGDVMWEENAITFRIGSDRPPQSGRLLVLAYNRWGEAPERFTIVSKPTPTPTATPSPVSLSCSKVAVEGYLATSARSSEETVYTVNSGSKIKLTATTNMTGTSVAWIIPGQVTGYRDSIGSFQYSYGPGLSVDYIPNNLTQGEQVYYIDGVVSNARASTHCPVTWLQVKRPNPTPTPTAIPLGLQVNTKRIDVTVQAGNSVRALRVTSTGASGFQFYGYPTKYGPGINWLPASGGIIPGRSVDVVIQVNSNVPPGVYSGTGILMNLTRQRIEIPVKIKVTRTFRPMPGQVN